MMLTLEEGTQIVSAARDITEAETQGKLVTPKLPASFSETKNGIFVSLHEHPSGLLRACVGFPVPPATTDRTLALAARGACYDERFPPLKHVQAQLCTFEVTVLTTPEKIVYDSVEELVNQIEIGKDGLIVRYFRSAGLVNSAVYLPQVPIEQGWNLNEYLNNICMKAGLQADAWKSGVLEFSKFQGEVFGEIEPYGDIVKK